MGTALVYDDEMTKYKLLWVDPVCELEVPERLQVSHQALVRSGLAGRCVPVPVREATDEEVLLVHSAEYLEGVKKTPFMDLEDLMAFTQQYGDVYFHPNIYHCAKLAIGATLQLVDRVMTGKVRNGMALVRPPGHHSQTSQANGFCVFNNVAIAAQYAKKHHGAKRVLIVDWDIHHGQGIQYCFEDDPSVLYFSWHRYEHQSFWPNLRESDFDSVGSGKGAGFNINVPWNQVGMGNSDYLAVFFHVLLPVAYEFGPDLVLISAGFDSAIGDPEGHMCATPDIFAHLTHLLMNLAGGKVCAVLEGGYNLTSLAQSVCQTVQTLLGDPPPHPANLGGPCESALESVHSARSVHKKYWSCLQHAGEPSTKTCRPAQQDGPQGPQSNGGGEAQKEAIAWPEPLQRVAPSVRTALVLPDAVPCADGCERFSPAEGPDSMATAGLRKHFLKESEDGVNVKLLYNITALVGKMEKNEVWHCLPFPFVPSYVLCVCSKHLHINFNHTLTYGCGDTVGLMQAALGLLLPLGYQYAPGLVLLVRPPGCRAREDLWLQLTGLLQGLAAGHTLVLVQENETASVGITASCLLGNAAPSLGSLAAPGPEDVESFERLRLRLQTDWPLLQTTETWGRQRLRKMSAAAARGARMKKDESFLGKLGGTLGRRKKSKEVSDLHEEGKNAINAPLLPSTIEIHPEDTLMEENAERVMLDPTSRENLKFKDLLKVLIDWINSELEEERIIVKDLEEDCYDGQVLQKLFEKLWGKKLNVAEVTQSEIVQKQKLQTVLEAVNLLLQPHGWPIEWSVDSIHSKNLVAIVFLLVSLAMHFQAPIRLPEHVSVQVVVVKKRDGLLQTGLVTKELTTTTEMMLGRFERDAFDTLLDHAPDKLNVVKTSLITFVNKHLNKLNLEVTELESQFADGVYLVLLMGLLEDYFVPLYNFFLTPESFEQKVHNVAFAFELMQDGGLKKPKARPEDVVNLNLKSTLRVLYNLFTNYKNSD
ncbi:unnamed protein product [Merluccius merluccius]